MVQEVAADRDDPLPDLIAAMISANADVWWLRRTGETTWEIVDRKDVPDPRPRAVNEGLIRIDEFRSVSLKNIPGPDGVMDDTGYLVEGFPDEGPLCFTTPDGRPMFDARLTLLYRNMLANR